MRKRYIIGGGVLGLAILFGSCGNPSQTPVAPSTAQAAPAAPSAAQAAPTAPAEPTGPQTSFGNGQRLVGEEIVPGMYRSTGPQEEDVIKLCMVQITPAPKNNPLGVETSNDGPVRVTLVAGQTVDVTGCETFQKVG